MTVSFSPSTFPQRNQRESSRQYEWKGEGRMTETSKKLNAKTDPQHALIDGETIETEKWERESSGLTTRMHLPRMAAVTR
jgi:hypothetical protein